jgi:hypothetical protein
MLTTDPLCISLATGYVAKGDEIRNVLWLPKSRSKTLSAVALPLWVTVVAEWRGEFHSVPFRHGGIYWRVTKITSGDSPVVDPVLFSLASQAFDQLHCSVGAKGMPVDKKGLPITSALTPKNPPNVLEKSGIWMHATRETTTHPFVRALLF